MRRDRSRTCPEHFFFDLYHFLVPGPIEILLFSFLVLVGGLVSIVWTLRTLKSIAERQNRMVALLEELVHQRETKLAAEAKTSERKSTEPQASGPAEPSST